MTKDEALAMDLALEALEKLQWSLEQADCSTGYCCCGSSVDGHTFGDGHSPVDEGEYCQSNAMEYSRKAITAIKKVRALDKMAENARELGLDYEPVAPVQEDWGPGPHECHSLTAAPAQEPVAWRYRGILHDFDPSDWAEGPVTPLYTTPPAAPVQVFDHVNAARQGLRDAQNRSRQISNLINCGTCGYPLAPEERTSLIERDGVMVKPAPVQEPDEWLTGCPECGMDSGCDCDSGTWNPPAAQRQWVGLTDAEVMQTMSGDWTSQFYFARAIEAKLKEKNT